MNPEKTVVSIQSQDFWFKIVDFLQQNWALIDPDSQGYTVWFMSDTSGVFDQLRFASIEDATTALRLNGFRRFEDDSEAAGFLALPKPPFIRSNHPNGSIYSSGRFWVSPASAPPIESPPRSDLELLPCVDSVEHANQCKRQLDIPRKIAKDLGITAVEASRSGTYQLADGTEIDWQDAVESSVGAKQSIEPSAALPVPDNVLFHSTRVQVANETTLAASLRLTQNGLKPLALNFANGISPGGGFRNGARAQEECLCRSSALYLTLRGDPMYEDHRTRPLPDSTEWSILSPDVPVFRTDDGTALASPWLLSIITCAAPYAPRIGQPESGDLLQRRIHRVFEIARAFGYRSLVLGAWGCGAFGNDPQRTAANFRNALEYDFPGAFSDVVFAISDWSAERQFLAPFRDVFSAQIST